MTSLLLIWNAWCLSSFEEQPSRLFVFQCRSYPMLACWMYWRLIQSFSRDVATHWFTGTGESGGRWENIRCCITDNKVWCGIVWKSKHLSISFRLWRFKLIHWQDIILLILVFFPSNSKNGKKCEHYYFITSRPQVDETASNWIWISTTASIIEDFPWIISNLKAA